MSKYKLDKTVRLIHKIAKEIADKLTISNKDKLELLIVDILLLNFCPFIFTKGPRVGKRCSVFFCPHHSKPQSDHKQDF